MVEHALIDFYYPRKVPRKRNSTKFQMSNKKNPKTCQTNKNIII